MKADRIVCGTNVLISAAIIAHGKPRRVLDYVRKSGQLLMSAESLIELETRLARPKFDRYLSVEGRRVFIDALSAVVELVVITESLRVCRDPDDDKILETAILGRADALVTGDRDLLALRAIGADASAGDEADAAYDNLVIVRPDEFLRLIASPQMP